MYGVGAWARAVVCLAAMLAADAASARYAEGTTMRAMPFDGALTAAQRRAVTFYHSVSQAHATAFMVLGTDAAFVPLFAIQLGAFLMTLVRKGLISTTTWHCAYTATLAVGVFVVSGREFAWVSAVGLLFAVARIWLGAPKHLVWAPLLATRLVAWPEHGGLAVALDAADAHAPVLRAGYLAMVACVAAYGLLAPGASRADVARPDKNRMQ
jgi:hypothetical protein